MNDFENMRGVDPRVLQFLQKKRERAESPNHALMAAMAQKNLLRQQMLEMTSFNRLGTIDKQS